MKITETSSVIIELTGHEARQILRSYMDLRWKVENNDALWLKDNSTFASFLSRLKEVVE
jgi:hypothetical protein